MKRDRLSNLDDLEVNAKYGKLGGYGNIFANIMFVGINPSINRPQLRDELEMGVFNENSKNDNLFKEALVHVGLERKDVFCTNLVKASTQNNREPTTEEANAYWKIFWAELAIIKPRVVVALGNFVFNYLFLRKHLFDLQRVALYKIHHPSYVLRGGMKRVDYLKEYEKFKSDFNDFDF